jgi:hypothetical protein
VEEDLLATDLRDSPIPSNIDTTRSQTFETSSDLNIKVTGLFVCLLQQEVLEAARAAVVACPAEVVSVLVEIAVPVQLLEIVVETAVPLSSQEPALLRALPPRGKT